MATRLGRGVRDGTCSTGTTALLSGAGRHGRATQNGPGVDVSGRSGRNRWRGDGMGTPWHGRCKDGHAYLSYRFPSTRRAGRVRVFLLELVFNLGIERYLRGSTLVQGLMAADALSSTYHSSSQNIAQHLYEAFHRLRIDSPFLAVALAAACGGSPTSPSSTPNPSPNPITTTNTLMGDDVRSFDGNSVNGASANIQFVDSGGRLLTNEDGGVINAQSTAGVFSLQIPGSVDLTRIRRARFTGSAFLSTERSVVVTEESPGVYRMMSGTPLVGGISSQLYDSAYMINHSARPPEGHHKVDPIA